MVSSDRIVATAVALLLALVLAPAAFALHDHDAGAQAPSHLDCDACHLRQISAVEAAGTPSSQALEFVSDTIVSAPQEGERTAHVGISPSRGPPA